MWQPLLWASFADYKGRRPLYIASLTIFGLANVLLATVPTNFVALVLLRMVQAFGASALVSLGAGTVTDVSWHPFAPRWPARSVRADNRIRSWNQRTEARCCRCSSLVPRLDRF